MPIFAKPLTPRKFKDQEFRKEILFAVGKTAKDVKKDFEKTTKTWKKKPVFEIVIAIGPKSADFLVGTDDEIYSYVDQGTKPHPIFAGIYTGKSNKKSLYFQWAGPGSYSAKTVPNVLGSRSGGSSGPMVNKAWVDHPGTEPRNFSKMIKRIWTPIYKKRIEQAISRANKKSNHAYK